MIQSFLLLPAVQHHVTGVGYDRFIHEIHHEMQKKVFGDSIHLPNVGLADLPPDTPVPGEPLLTALGMMLFACDACEYHPFSKPPSV